MDRICASANSSGAEILRRYDAIIDLDTTTLHPDEGVAAVYAFGPTAGSPYKSKTPVTANANKTGKMAMFQTMQKPFC